MKTQESLDSISRLSDVIGWLQREKDMRGFTYKGDRKLEEMINGLLVIRECIRKDHEASMTNTG